MLRKGGSRGVTGEEGGFCCYWRSGEGRMMMTRPKERCQLIQQWRDHTNASQAIPRDSTWTLSRLSELSGMSALWPPAHTPESAGHISCPMHLRQQTRHQQHDICHIAKYDAIRAVAHDINPDVEIDVALWGRAWFRKEGLVEAKSVVSPMGERDVERRRRRRQMAMDEDGRGKGKGDNGRGGRGRGEG